MSKLRGRKQKIINGEQGPRKSVKRGRWEPREKMGRKKIQRGGKKEPPQKKAGEAKKLEKKTPKRRGKGPQPTAEKTKKPGSKSNVAKREKPKKTAAGRTNHTNTPRAKGCTAFKKKTRPGGKKGEMMCHKRLAWLPVFAKN